LVLHFGPKPFRFESIEEVGTFALLGAAFASLVGATIIAAIDVVMGKAEFGNVWPLALLGDASGLLVSTPLTFVVIQAWRERVSISTKQIVEAAAILGALMAVGLAVFYGYLPTEFALMPPLLWAAARFRLKGAAAALAFVTVMSAMFAMLEFDDLPDDRLRERVIMLQTFLAIAALSAMVVASLAVQRQTALDGLRAVNVALEQRVAEQTTDLRESERRMRLFVEHAPASIAMFDRELKCVAASRRWMLEHQCENGGTLRIESLPGSSDVWRARLLQSMDGAVLESDGEPLAASDGPIVWLKWEVLPWRNTVGQVGGILIATEDITRSKNTEQALRESEARFRNMADQAPVMIRLTEGDGNCSYLSKSWYEFTGHSTVRGLGWDWLDSVHPEDAVRARSDFLEAIASRRAFTMEYRLLRADGAYCWTIDSARPRYSAKGEFQGHVGSITDIDERKRAEEQLRASHETFQHLVEGSPFGVYVVDSEFRVALVGAGAKEYFKNVAPLIGRDFAEVIRVVWPEPYASEIILLFRHTLESGETYHATSNAQVRLDTGELESYDWKLERLSLPDGKFGLVCHFYNLSDRQRFEAALVESETRIRMLADNMSQSAWMADELGGIFWYNQRWYEYTGTTFEQMKGWGWRDVHHPEHVDRVIEKFRQCIERGIDWEDTFPLRGKDGEYRWFLSRAVPIRNEQGNVTRWFGTNTDVTELRRIEAELQRARLSAESANRAKSDFLANMSHEIRSPMTAILGYLDLLHAADESEQEKIETIRRNGNYLLALINDILDLSKIEAGKFELEQIDFSPRRLVEEVVSLMSIRASESDLLLQHRFSSPIPAVLRSDATRIRQILINLVSNAIKFTEGGGVTIEVSCSQDPPRLQFEVIDTGIGMTSEQVERLFLPFEQADSSIVRRFGGSGLGLAISHRLASLLGGTIRVTTQPGAGSRFALSLPVPVDVELESPSSTKVEEDQPASRRAIDSGQLTLRIMVVDDRRDVRFLVNHFIRELGCETVLCTNGAEAVAKIEDERRLGNHFDIVLMDMQMPVMDGVTAVRQLRERGFVMPVIALTANAMSTDRDTCLEAGFTDWLTKPIDKLQLSETLRRYA
jgi:PAS domain S-box-containing protein